MHIIINTEYNSFHTEVTPTEFDTLMKVLSRVKAVERVWGGDSNTETVYKPDGRLTGSLSVLAVIHKPATPEIEPQVNPNAT